MVDNKLTVQATGTSPAWPRILEQANVAAGFELVLQPDPYQPTDVASFNQASVPVPDASSRARTPTITGRATPPTRSTTRISIASSALRRRSCGASATRRRRCSSRRSTSRPTPAAAAPACASFTGTIPDYATNVKGLLLGGVIGGGPAEQAGLQKGDVIVEINGQSITNIYDYTYALETLKIGQGVKVVYMRAANGARRR